MAEDALYVQPPYPLYPEHFRLSDGRYLVRGPDGVIEVPAGPYQQQEVAELCISYNCSVVGAPTTAAQEAPAKKSRTRKAAAEEEAAEEEEASPSLDLEMIDE